MKDSQGVLDIFLGFGASKLVELLVIYETELDDALSVTRSV